MFLKKVILFLLSKMGYALINLRKNNYVIAQVSPQSNVSPQVMVGANDAQKLAILGLKINQCRQPESAEEKIDEENISVGEAKARKILKLNPTDQSAKDILLQSAKEKNTPDAWRDLGKFLLAMNCDRRDAMRCFGHALALDPSDVRAQRNQFLLLHQSQGEFYQQMGKRHALVTGGANGIGLAIVRRLEKMGVRITVVDKDKEALERLDNPRDLITPVCIDIANEGDLQKFIGEIKSTIDTLILNAAVFHEDEFSNLNVDDARRLIRNNFLSNVQIVQGIANEMKNGGRIITVGTASINSPMLTKNISHYLASKAALSTFCMGLCAELVDRRVMVNEVLCCDAFDTPMIRKVRSIKPDQSLADPDIVAKIVVSFVKADLDESFITGTSIDVYRPALAK